MLQFQLTLEFDTQNLEIGRLHVQNYCEIYFSSSIQNSLCTVVRYYTYSDRISKMPNKYYLAGNNISKICMHIGDESRINEMDPDKTLHRSNRSKRI